MIRVATPRILQRGISQDFLSLVDAFGCASHPLQVLQVAVRYIIVNNDFHVLLLEEHAPTYLAEARVIGVPHRLAPAILKRVRYYTEVQSPLTRRFACFNLWAILRARRQISIALRDVGPGDVLLLFTEYELLNQAAAHLFRRRGGHVYLLEENGLASYACNKLASVAVPLWRAHPKYLPAQLFWSCLDSRGVISDGVLYPIGKDEWLNGVVYFDCVSSSRQLPHYCIKGKSVLTESEIPVLALYLNQDIYNFFMSEDEYFVYLEHVLIELQKAHERVLFKFHPREVGKPIEQRIRAILGGCEVVSDNSPIETFIQKLPPVAIFSFMSSALISLQRRGYSVNFLFPEWAHYRRSLLLVAIEESLFEIKNGTQLGSSRFTTISSLSELV